MDNLSKLRINYSFLTTPLTGGTKVLFEVANHLVDRGHEVTITSLSDNSDHAWFPLKAKANYSGTNHLQNSVISKLKPLSKKILPRTYTNKVLVSMMKSQIKDLTKQIPDCDINVATYCLTAYSVLESKKGKPFYHIQNYEPWFFEDQRLAEMAEKTYHLPLTMLVNCTWLKKQMNERYGYDLPVVTGAVDHNIFYPRNIKKSSDEIRIVCMAKQQRFKGFPEALDAVRLIAKKKANVKFIAFGTKQPSFKTDVPYEFVEAPSDDQLAELYSSADVVLCPAWFESFALYPFEALACGAPIVTTPYGTEDYAFNGKNCLVVPPKDSKSLAESALKLLNNIGLQEEFRKEGPKIAKQFTYEKTTDKVEEMFKAI